MLLEYLKQSHKKAMDNANNFYTSAGKQVYIKEKYDNIVKNRYGSMMFEKNKGSGVLECRIPNGTHKFYSFGFGFRLSSDGIN